MFWVSAAASSCWSRRIRLEKKVVEPLGNGADAVVIVSVKVFVIVSAPVLDIEKGMVVGGIKDCVKG